MPDVITVLLAIYLVIWSLIGLVLAIGALIIVWKIKRAITSTQKAVEPVLQEARSVMSEVSLTVRQVAERARHISEVAEQTVSRIAERVERTADLVQETISSPLISVGSALSGLRRGVEVWRERLQRRGRPSPPPPGAAPGG